MMPFAESVLISRTASEHIVQLFDDSDSLTDAVTTFVGEGLSRGDAILLVLTSPHWDMTAERLTATGCDVQAALQDGRLVLRDAATLLDEVRRKDVPDAAAFDAHVGALVRNLRSTGRHLRVYGEMVNLLSWVGDYRGAHKLEDLWNSLQRREAFTLFCGYSAVNFGNPATAPALRQICDSHSHIRSNPRDMLATFLLRFAVPGHEVSP
jgi:hypothetical protein